MFICIHQRVEDCLKNHMKTNIPFIILLAHVLENNWRNNREIKNDNIHDTCISKLPVNIILYAYKLYSHGIACAWMLITLQCSRMMSLRLALVELTYWFVQERTLLSDDYAYLQYTLMLVFVPATCLAQNKTSQWKS